jgi:F-type H+/Na+-transporting ATPase subunit alpha
MSELTISAQSITDALKKNLADWSPEHVRGDGRLRDLDRRRCRPVEGLPNVMASELLEFPGGLLG